MHPHTDSSSIYSEIRRNDLQSAQGKKKPHVEIKSECLGSEQTFGLTTDPIVPIYSNKSRERTASGQSDHIMHSIWLKVMMYRGRSF